MNVIIIVLAVIIVIMAYYIYTFFTAPPSVATNLYLKDGPPKVDPTKISQPFTVNYTIGVWIYVDTFTSNIGRFIMYGNAGNSGENSLFAFVMDSTAPTLSVEIAGQNTGGSGPTTSSKNVFTITKNFPLQTWTYVVVSVNTYYADAYVNGKLVVSKKLDYPSATSTNADLPTFSFASGPDMHITGLARWAKALDPQSVWSNYVKGNGNPSGDGTKYGAQFVLTKDTNNYSWKLF